ncbi:unnamed protein product [Dovyalis caffra]|uniref:Uncharacterized protein n=1 Tax=Dovyalis caffra TaxID=77055 RepID=A0AAV1STF1_9ROSI|nr:unnamed protein product [Dovyalis caffra]
MFPAAILDQKLFKSLQRETHITNEPSSETLVIEDQPSWLDDLLNEPETYTCPERRMSTDIKCVAIPSWGSQDFDYYKDVRQTSLHAELNMTKKKNRARDSSLNAPKLSVGIHKLKSHMSIGIKQHYQSGLSSARENAGLQSSGSSFVKREADGVSESEKQDPLDGPHNPKISSEKKESSSSKCSASETVTKVLNAETSFEQIVGLILATLESQQEASYTLVSSLKDAGFTKYSVLGVILRATEACYVLDGHSQDICSNKKLLQLVCDFVKLSDKAECLFARENADLQSSGSSFAPREADGVSESEKQDPFDGPHDPKISSDKKESSYSKCSASETDTKRAKQKAILGRTRFGTSVIAYTSFKFIQLLLPKIGKGLLDALLSINCNTIEYNSPSKSELNSTCERS